MIPNESVAKCMDTANAKKIILLKSRSVYFNNKAYHRARAEMGLWICAVKPPA